ncbi:AAA family ATPase [Methylobacterium sp. E-041]|uniref:AAA family ATPase n=1 Tax=Methylobacterium sp. E-041 TaxID=2836573 RepID=UPI001FBA7C44|nr:AAA family ATPase [Methylobacterium sp. E-041]MCJ2105395.1 AAA family ATPase [Methylobacterium sp. E-041]
MKKQTKTPAQVLKTLPRKAAHVVIDAEGDGLDGYPGYGEQAETATPEQVLASASVSTILAIATVNATLPSRVIARILTPPSLALVVGVPGADWVSPIAHALTSFRAWTEVLKRDGSKKVSDKGSVGNDFVAGALAAGRSVLGVSTAPDRYLPAALMTAADLRVDIGAPNARAIRATIRLVTGRRGGPIPVDIIRGLSFDEITACLRKGSTSRDCIRRLKAASASKRSACSDLADVPLVEDTWGYGPAGDHARALVEAVKAHRLGAPWPAAGTRFVLAGPPGTGKTSLARSIAKSLGVGITATSVSSWFAQTGGYLNDICRKVDEIFLEASQAGGVLLIDEIDSLPNRETCDSRHREYWVNVVSHILTTLDGAVSSPASKLIIIGATNFPERLDPALTRPGRLDRIVRIDLPDEVAIQGILRQHLAGDLDDQDLAPIAAIGAGATGADIAGWASGARMVAAAAKRPMTMMDLLARIVPPETRSPAEQLSVARHEASHAVALELKGAADVTTVSIVAKGEFAGRTSSRLNDTSKMSPSELDDLIVCILAGRAADQHFGAVTSGSAGGSRSDLAHATALVAGKHASWGLGKSLLYRGDQDDALALIRFDPAFRRTCEEDLSRLYEVSRDLVSRNGDLIDRIAHRLVECRVIGGAEVRAIIADATTALAKGAPQSRKGGPHA